MLKYANLTSPVPLATLQGRYYSCLHFTQKEIGLIDLEFFPQGHTSPKQCSLVLPGMSVRLILRMFVEHLRKGEEIVFAPGGGGSCL